MGLDPEGDRAIRDLWSRLEQLGVPSLESHVPSIRPHVSLAVTEEPNGLRQHAPGLTQAEANSAAWNQGRRLLERAIAERATFAFETTLGGATMTALLERALAAGLEVRLWYVGLASPELHLARVRARVAQGGHDIPEADIRRRFHDGRMNLVRLLERLTELRVYDNSAEADPHAGGTPSLVLLLHLVRGKIAASCDLARTPQWAKPILAAALKSSSA